MRFNEKLAGLLCIGLGFIGLLSSGLGLSWFGGVESSQPGDSLTVSNTRQSFGHRLKTSGSLTSSPSATPFKTRQACQVLTVYDGDTLGCDLNQNGSIERPEEEVRLLGIDSPEMHYSRKNPTFGSQHPTDELYAKEASQFLTSRTDHQTVFLEFDQKRQDKYGRTLAYVFAERNDTGSINQEAIAQGYATVLFLGKNRRYELPFLSAENRARESGRGLWKYK